MEMQSKKSTLTPEALKLGIDRIKMASHRIKNIIEAMRTLTREEYRDEMISYPLNKLISEVLSLCFEKSIAAGIKVTVENEINDKEILCLPTELGQVLINLLNNSFDAIADLDEKFINIKMREKKGSIIISILDSGKGIPLNIEQKMFNPFYTTKPVGKGVGIGMSISKKIVEMHQGTIKVDRKSAHTKIDITLPILVRE